MLSSLGGSSERVNKMVQNVRTYICVVQDAVLIKAKRYKTNCSPLKDLIAMK